jgi:hypothetical protein
VMAPTEFSLGEPLHDDAALCRVVARVRDAVG